MPGLVLHEGAVLTCSHGGKVTFAPAQTRALVAGTPIATMSDQITVTGCPGVSGVVCTKVQWANASGRVTASGQPVLVQAPPPSPPPVPGGGAVIGPPPPVPLVLAMQLRVVAT
jgi:hypothetical protein